ncbi:MAG TPA: hypothetical protein VIT92_09140 [Burkholderiaceae bacterium]
MASTQIHRGVSIVTLAPGETVAQHGRPHDIVLTAGEGGWWCYFIGEDGVAESYDVPYATEQEALHAAKAAAEYSADD